jgi:hypothetical protein
MELMRDIRAETAEDLYIFSILTIFFGECSSPSPLRYSG